jgi:tuftelin-interacting protein 11
MREVSSLAEIATASWTPSTDSMRIPEVRHNLRLLVDAARSDLVELTKEAKILEERRKRIPIENARLRTKMQEETERKPVFSCFSYFTNWYLVISRLRNVRLIVDDIKTQAEKNNGDYEPSLEAFSPHIESLITQFQKEYDIYMLDEIVIAAIAPVVMFLFIAELLSS